MYPFILKSQWVYVGFFFKSEPARGLLINGGDMGGRVRVVEEPGVW